MIELRWLVRDTIDFTDHGKPCRGKERALQYQVAPGGLWQDVPIVLEDEAEQGDDGES